MRLLKDELYKITSRRIVQISVIAAIAIQLFCVMSNVMQERSAVNGKEYRGVSAIRKDRALFEFGNL